MKAAMGMSITEEKNAVDAGYWHLYRYNPDLKKEWQESLPDGFQRA